MKCLESEKLIGYAYRLTDEAATAQVRAHLSECSRCRAIVQQYGRLNAALSEWKVDEPTLGFDARVRQAIEAQQAGRRAWGFWGWQWARGLALAALGAVMVVSAAWFAHHRTGISHAPQVAARHPQPAPGKPAPPEIATLHSPAVPARAARRPVQVAGEAQTSGVGLNADKVTQALEDYDLAANFDLLSELPKSESRVVN